MDYFARVLRIIYKTEELEIVDHIKQVHYDIFVLSYNAYHTRKYCNKCKTYHLSEHIDFRGDNCEGTCDDRLIVGG